MYGFLALLTVVGSLAFLVGSLAFAGWLMIDPSACRCGKSRYGGRRYLNPNCPRHGRTRS